MSEQIAVSFAGTGAGVGGLTWGQQQVWAAMVETNSSLAMGGVVPIAAGRTIEEFVDALRFFMSRFASMRTRLRFADDSDGDAGVTQEVSAAGTTALHLLDASDDEDPAEVAERLAQQWRDRVFDYVHEWPLRMGVVRHRNAPTHVVAVMSHLAADLGGVSAMMRELGERDLGAALPAPTHPLDLRAEQQLPAAQRHTAAAMRYWGAHLRAIAPRRFAAPVDRGEPRYWRVIWSSPAMYLATETMTARSGADPAWALLAAFAVGVGRICGACPLVAQVIVGNRFRPGLRDIVSPVTQTGLCVLDVADTTADEAVARARMASMSASKYAYYDPATRHALFADVERERRERVELGCLYNNRRTIRRPDGVAHASSVDELRAAIDHSVVVRDAPMPFFNEQLMVNIEDVPDTVELTAEFNTDHVSREQLWAILTQMEAFTVEAALDPGAATGVLAGYSAATR